MTPVTVAIVGAIAIWMPLSRAHLARVRGERLARRRETVYPHDVADRHTVLGDVGTETVIRMPPVSRLSRRRSPARARAR